MEENCEARSPESYTVVSATGTPENYTYAYDGRVGTYFRCVGQVEVIYHTWSTMTLERYDTLYLAVEFSITNSSNSDPWEISYSTDGGSNWSVMATGTGIYSYTQDTVTLSVAVDLADIQVKVVNPTGKTIRVYEIYTMGCIFQPSQIITKDGIHGRIFGGSIING